MSDVQNDHPMYRVIFLAAVIHSLCHAFPESRKFNVSFLLNDISFTTFEMQLLLLYFVSSFCQSSCYVPIFYKFTDALIMYVHCSF